MLKKIINQQPVDSGEREALIALQARHEALVTFADSIVGEVDSEGRFIYVSPSVERIVGQTPEQLVGQSGFDYIHPDDHETVSATLQHLFGGGVGSRARVALRWRNTAGAYRNIDFQAVCYERADGSLGTAYHATDITEREATIRRLRDSEQRLESALDATGLGIWEWDVSNQRITVDSSYERLLGYAPGEMDFSAGPQRYVHPEDLDHWQSVLGETLKPGGNRDIIQARLKRKSGQWMRVQARYKISQRDAQGRATHVIGTIKDIDSETRAQEEAHRANRRVALVLESTEEGIVGLDEAGAVSFVNPAAERMLGASRGALLGMDFSDKLMRKQGADTQRASPVMAALRDGERLQRLRANLLRADGSHFPVEYSVSPIREGRDLRGVVIVFRDETLARRLASRLHHQLLHDAVTGLSNRQGFENATAELLSDARQKGTVEHALLYMNLDQFRVINSTCGHAAGDELLRQLAVRLDEELPDYHTLARIGGDEFGVLLQDCPLERAGQVAQHLRRVIADFSFVHLGKAFHVSVSIGVVAITATGQSREELLAAADAACFEAKEAGRNRIHVVQESDPVIAQRREEMAWAAQIREALDSDNLVLFSQPIVPISAGSGLAAHAEILLRMRGMDGEIIPPGKFLPAAEHHFLMSAIDHWVLRRLLHEMARHPGDNKRYSLNLTGGTLSEEGLLEEIQGLISASGVNPARLCFEITETAAIANLTQALRLMAGLREMGCEFALDDFGSGMSSLNYLRQLPVDYVKIDGTFVRGMLDDPVDLAIVQAVYDVAGRLGIATVAEHVESEAIMQKLAEIGIDYAQGFHTGRPAPLNAAVADNDVSANLQ